MQVHQIYYCNVFFTLYKDLAPQYLFVRPFLKFWGWRGQKISYQRARIRYIASMRFSLRVENNQADDAWDNLCITRYIISVV